MIPRVKYKLIKTRLAADSQESVCGLATMAMDAMENTHEATSTESGESVEMGHACCLDSLVFFCVNFS